MQNKIVSLLAALSLFPALATAQIETYEPKGFATISMGLGLLEKESSLGYGANLGILFANNIAGSAFFLASGNQTDEAQAEMSHYGFGGDYRFSAGALENLSIGARVGAATEMVNNETQTGFALGPHVAYDYPVTQEFSLGAEAMMMLNSTVESRSTTYVQAMGRYWF